MLMFSNIVAESAKNAVDQTADNLDLIAKLFDKVASFITDNDILIDDRDILSNTVKTIDSLFQWMPDVIEADSASRYVLVKFWLSLNGVVFLYRILNSYESILSLHIQQIPENLSQLFNFTTSLLLSEKVSLIYQSVQTS